MGVLHRTGSVALGIACWIAALTSGAQAQVDPAMQLRQLQPQVFHADNTQAAALWGVPAVRILEVSSALGELGFQSGDHVIAVQGMALGSGALTLDAEATVYTVVRSVSGQRPVFDGATVGRTMLSDFLHLDPAQRTPMRLTRMVANSWTWMQEGRGVVLLPPSAGNSDDAWLRYATPLPAPSETGVQEAARGVTQRVDLPRVDSEAEAARSSYANDDVLVAQERASRAILQWIVDPKQRQASDEFPSLLQLYEDASSAVAERRREMLAPSPWFGVFVEGGYSFVQKMLPQETLMTVENSNGWGARGGLRMRVVRWIDALLSYGYRSNDFQDDAGRTKITTGLHSGLFELAYRPVVLSYLKPVLRAGIGVYTLQTSVFTDAGEAVFTGSSTNVGGEFAAGIDAFYWKNAKLRGTATVSFRLLEFTFGGCDSGCATERWPEAANLPPGSLFDPSDPLDFLDPKGVYTYNLNSWMLGFMLTRDL